MSTKWRDARLSPPNAPPPPLRRGPRSSSRPVVIMSVGSSLLLWALWVLSAPPAPAPPSALPQQGGEVVATEVATEVSTEVSTEVATEPPPAAGVMGGPPPQAPPPLDLTRPTLSWWVERVTPAIYGLERCVAALPGRAYSARSLGVGEVEITREGRATSQRLTVTAEQVWLHTPLSTTALAQVYEHLSVLSCLRSEGSSLHDPLLARVWPSSRWPSLSPSGGAPLDDLVRVESSGGLHFTRGLTRLGGVEQGLLSDHPNAREALRRLVAEWLARPVSEGEVRSLGGVAWRLSPASAVGRAVGRAEVRVWAPAEGGEAEGGERTPDALVERVVEGGREGGGPDGREEGVRGRGVKGQGVKGQGVKGQTKPPSPPKAPPPPPGLEYR